MAKKKANVRVKQAPRPDVPHDQHVVRYCSPQKVIRHPETDEFQGIFPQAFTLKPGEPYLSVSWYEKFAGDANAKCKAAVAAFRSYIVGVNSRSAIAILNVGKVVQTGVGHNHIIRFRDRASRPKPQYVAIEGFPKEETDMRFIGAINNECCVTKREIGEVESSQ